MYCVHTTIYCVGIDKESPNNFLYNMILVSVFCFAVAVHGKVYSEQTWHGDFEWDFMIYIILNHISAIFETRHSIIPTQLVKKLNTT